MKMINKLDKFTKQKIYTLLKILTLIVFLSAFISYAFANQSSFKHLLDISPLALLIIGLLQLGVLGVNILYFKESLSFYGAITTKHESYGVIVKSSLINFFGFLQGGTGYRAWYAKKNFNINYKKFVLLFTANSIAIFLVCSLAGLIGTLGYAITTGILNIIVVSFFVLVSLMLIILASVKPSLFIFKHKTMERIRSVIEQWHNMTSNKPFITRLMVLAIVQFFISYAVFATELLAIGQHPSLFGLLGYTALANLSIIIAFTPGAIGIRELLLLFSQNALGVSTNSILLAATIDRLVYFLLLLTLAASLPFIQRPSSKNLDNISKEARPV